MMACPERDQLELLLAKRLADTAREELEMHVEDCDACQQVLELLTEFTDWEPTRKQGGDPSHPRNRAGEPAGAAAGLQRLGGYRIDHELGRGGMGVVYEAEHESLKNRVALKVMHPRFRADRTYLRRFRSEARSAAKLHHTNIVAVFDYGEQDGICYYAMQCIDGVSLERVLEDVRRLRAAADCGSGVRTGAAGEGTVTVTDAGADAPTAISRGLLTGRFGVAPTDSLVAGSNTTTAAIDRATTGVRAGVDGSASAPSGGGVASGSTSLGDQPESVYFREVARLGAQVADALDYAHRQGVIHRDIKPSNLMLDTHGNVWVTDFGLAKLVEGDDLSQSHDLVGTLRFMAPERFRGVTSPLGDVYSLGAALYELLTLKPAFAQRDQGRLIDQVTHDPPAPLRQHDRRIPRDLETIVLKALAKDPKDRFVSAAELGDELRRYLESRPIRSRPIPTLERLWRWCKRNPGLAAMNALAASLILIILVGSNVAAWTYHAQRNDLLIEQGLTRASLARAEVAEHQSRLDLGQSLISEGAALQRTGLMGQRFKSLDRLGKAAQVLGADPAGRKRLPEIRNHAIAALGLTDLRATREHDCGDFFDLNVDVALERYAVVEKSGEIVVHRLDDNRVLVRLPGPERVDFWAAFPLFSPDGDLLVAVYVRSGGRAGALLRVWHLGRRELVGSLPSWTGAVFHPDRRRLVFGAREGGIAVWDCIERRLDRRLSLDFRPSSLAIDQEGRRLAVAGSSTPDANGAEPRVAILELETGRVLFDWKSQVGDGGLAWSADGQLLAVCGSEDDNRVFVWNVRRGTLTAVLEGHTSSVLTACFAHSGYLLATEGWDATTRLWDAASGQPLAMAPGRLRGSFAPDDRRLAYVGVGKVGVWDVAVATECKTLHPDMLGNRSETRGNFWVIAADVSPDGKLMATGDRDGVHLWETDTGREVAHLQSGRSNTVLFHPDGGSLVISGQSSTDRWPIRSDPDGGVGALLIGPPELLSATGGRDWPQANWLPDRRTLALADSVNARVVLIDSSHPHPAWSRATTLDSAGNDRMTSVAVSPDGRWLAFGGWKEIGVGVWDLRRRRLERILTPKELAGVLSYFVDFSPDGRWLVSSTLPEAGPGYYHFWGAGTWEAGPRIDQEGSTAAFYRPAFTGDGRLMAMGIAPDQVLLADAATGRELARLTTLHPVIPTPIVFSPDGSKLVVRTSQKTVLVWDLRQIRDQLGILGLDWDAPPYPAATESRHGLGLMPAPRAVRVIGEAIDLPARCAAELAEMNRRLTAKPDDPEALIHRGWLYTQQKKRPEAIADLEHLLRLRPGDSDASWLLAEAYLESGKPAGALAALNRLLERAPEDRDARFQRGLVALTLALPALAADDFSFVLAHEPDRDGPRCCRAQALSRLGRHREALADLDQLIPKDPENDALYNLRGAVREALGDRERARADREKSVSLLPKNAVTLNDRAWKFATGPFAERDPERAVVWARRAVALAPGVQQPLNTLGVALYRVGLYAEAISFLNQSRAVTTSEPEAYDLFFLAMAHHQLGHRGQARDSYDRAVRWLEKQTSLPESDTRQLAAFRAEAEALLADFAPDLPVDTFAPPTQKP